MKSKEVPRHIAIIMDGNGRWAQQRGLVRIQGHRQGARVVRKIARACADRGVEYLTLYAFSSENWERPEREVHLLMKLLKTYVTRERAYLRKENVRLQVIGDISRLPKPVQEELAKTVLETSANTGLCLQLALSYGGREEILRAVRRWQESSSEALNEKSFERYLDTAGQPDPDLVIRTSGEQRLSNFLIWQAAYAELYFTQCLWPDFDELELDRAIEAYQNRERRFGKVSESKVQGGNG